MIITGLGSLPGTDFAGAVRSVFESAPDLPYLPELPDRGAGADMTGRACAALAGLSVDLQPAGWRLTSGSSRAGARARATLRRDLDDLEETAHGFQGQLKVSFAGPWTLAASVERRKGDKLLVDAGARREISESLAEGLRTTLSELAKRLPTVQLVVQLDEPLLPSVLAGRVPTASGYARHRAIDRYELVDGLRRVVDATRSVAAVQDVLLHCCAAGLEIELVRRAGVSTFSLDAALINTAQWDQISKSLEAGDHLWLGVAPTAQGRPTPTDELVRRTLSLLRPLELAPAIVMAGVSLTPACGLAGWQPPDVTTLFNNLRQAAGLVDEQLFADR